MIKKRLEIRPLSVNMAFQGRRFKSKAYKQYERDLGLLLTGVPKNALQGRLRVCIDWHLKHHATTDFDNPIKTTMDILKKNEIIQDDRFIYEAHIKKHKSDTDYFTIQIEEIEDGRHEV